MSEIYDYLKKFNKSFKESSINDIDKAIFTLISYVDFQDIVDDNKMKFKDALRQFFALKDKKTFYKKSPFNKDVYTMLELLYSSDRYSDIYLSNYKVINDEDEQFAAITIHLPDKIVFISYEGTDMLVSGWKEDFELSYMYPIPAQVDAIEYTKKVIKSTNSKVILGGHSKGGNLALVSAMNLSFFDRFKLKEIFSVDGPGLKEEEFNSKEFKRIKNKYRHLIPNYSIVGQLLHNINDEVVKSHRIDIYSHSPLEWEVVETKFQEAELHPLSIKFKERVNNWINNKSLQERQKIIEDLFNILKVNNIVRIDEISRPNNLFRIYKETKKLDDETKEIIKSIIRS